MFLGERLNVRDKELLNTDTSYEGKDNKKMGNGVALGVGQVSH